MSHDEAIRLQAVARYVLGELSERVRDEFEEHCFECPECALDLEAAVKFVANARAVFRAET